MCPSLARRRRRYPGAASLRTHPSSCPAVDKSNGKPNSFLRLVWRPSTKLSEIRADFESRRKRCRYVYRVERISRSSKLRPGLSASYQIFHEDLETETSNYFLAPDSHGRS